MHRVFKTGSRSRTAVAVAATIATLSVLAGCGGSATDGESDEEIVLGAAVAKSGGYEVYDNELIAGMQYKINEINAAGGIDGHKIKLIVGDHKTDMSRVAATTQQLIDQGADVIVSTSDYTFAGPAALVAGNAGKLLIGGAGAPEYGRQGLGSLAFNVFQGTPTEAASMVQMAKNLGVSNPFLIKDTSIEYSQSVCDLFDEAWQAAGGSIAGEASFKQDDPSVTSQVNAVRRSNADFVVACSYPPGGANLIRQLRSSNVKVPIIGGVAYDGTFWLDSLTDLRDFYFPGIAASAGDDPNPKINQFLKDVKPKGGALYALFGYEVVEITAKAIEEAGSTDGKALAKALEGWKDVELLVGKTTYTADCHIPLGRPMVEQQIKDGAISYVGSVKPTVLPKTVC